MAEEITTSLQQDVANLKTGLNKNFNMKYFCTELAVATKLTKCAKTRYEQKL